LAANIAIIVGFRNKFIIAMRSGEGGGQLKIDVIGAAKFID
jgi:hypothetical protein